MRTHTFTQTLTHNSTLKLHSHTHHSVTHTFLLSLQVYWYKAALCTAHSVLATMCTHSSAPRYKCTWISDKSRVPAHVPACVWSYESVVFIGITNTQQCWRYSFVMENTRFRSKPLPLDVVLMSDATAHKPLGIIWLKAKELLSHFPLLCFMSLLCFCCGFFVFVFVFYAFARCIVFIHLQTGFVVCHQEKKKVRASGKSQIPWGKLF